MAESISAPASNGIAAPAAVQLNVPKMSFASVAAMAPKKADVQASKPEEKPLRAVDSNTSGPPQPIVSNEIGTSKREHDLNKGISNLSIQEKQEAGVPAKQIDSQAVLSTENRLDDEKTHLSVSSTKAPSLDGKSVASGATFGMDEKESLRPDDSASVQAAEDDDSNSGPGTGDANSRLGSDSGARPFHHQYHEISERSGTNSLQRPTPLSRRLLLGNADEARKGAQQPSGNPQTNSPEVGAEIGVSATAPPLPAISNEPDEKLLEALESPKDRLFLLHLEQQFVTFIRDSQGSTLDLPPCNSFCRLLAHRLGDYYQLPHFVDNSVSSVRLYKNPTNYLPAPISTFRRRPTNTDESGNLPSMKIMRRTGSKADSQTVGSGDNTTVSSVALSKPGSETEDEQRDSGLASPTESTAAKDKASQTREEREANYQAVRDRIFGDWKENEGADVNKANDNSNEASRASSASGKKARKKPKNDDEFQARSAYNVYYPTARHGPYDQSTSGMGFYNPPMQPSNGQIMQPGFYSNFGQQYPSVPTMQSYPLSIQSQGQMQQGMPHGSGVFPPPNPGQQYMNYPQHPPQLPGQFYPQVQQQQAQPAPPPQSMSAPTLGSNASQHSYPQSQISEQSWVPNSYSNQHSGFGSQQGQLQPQNRQNTQGSPLNNASMPYAYGQLPFPSSPQSGRTAHPVPGSYNRQNFNPQTRSFVPGSNNFSTPMSSQNIRQNAPLTPQMGTAPATFSSPQLPPVPPNTLSPYHGLAATTTPPKKQNGQLPSSPSPGQSSLSKWATPSTLPPKPPPPASSSHNPTNGSNPAARSVPTFRNGSYSKPNV